MGAPLLALEGITKAFPGTLANDDVSLSLEAGEIHALLGENGAGKSTLVKVIYGLLEADSGRLLWRGEPVDLSGPAAARRLGIGMVFQHFSLFEAMTVMENIALAGGGDPRDPALRQRLRDLSEGYGLPLDPERQVSTLSVGERQRIEILRCLLQNPELLILDEPTSVLTPQEVERLFATLRQLASEGCAILYISHKLDEVRALCERATVLRGGRVVAECDPRQESAGSLAELMIGNRVQAAGRAAVPAPEQAAEGAAPRLAVQDLSLEAETVFGTALKGISFSLAGGEILGIAGIAGNGQAELMAALGGERRLRDKPEAIRIDGEPVAHRGPGRRRALGAVFVPEERNGHAAVTALPLTENAFLTAFRRLRLVLHGLIRGERSRAFAERIVAAFDVRTTGPDAEAGSLSGGNLQKFVVGREMLQEPSLMVIAQPTWGVDPGAAATVRQALLDLSARGAAVLVVSQDLDEILQLCDRVAVISEGRLSAPRAVAQVTVEELGLLMGGLHDLATSTAGAREAAHAAPA